VLAVVLFHAAVPGVPGGFVGVDVFFVVSGFLITGMLWREVERTGRVRAARFYGARARRLLPAGILVIVATAAASAWLLPPLQARTVLGDGVASALYVANYRFAVQGTDYLAADSPPSTFQHYWSLGVEEQFYLVWPALLVATAAVALRLRRGSGRRPVFAPVLVLATVAVVSFAVSLRWTTDLPPWAFFSLPSRAWQLAVGGLVALGASLWRRMPAGVAGSTGWLGLGLIVLAAVRLDDGTPYPGLAAVVPVAGTALVVAAGCARSRWGAGSLLSLAPLRWGGRISYSWYLWHWPVLLLAPVLMGHGLGLGGRLVAAALSGVLAAGTLVALENPVRFGRLRRAPGRSVLLGAGLTAAGVCACLVALAVVPPPVGQGAQARTPEIDASAPRSTTTPSAALTQRPEDAVLQRLTDQVQAAVAASADVRAVPANLTPPLAEAPTDKPAVFTNGCLRSWRYVGQDECASGDTSAPTRVALVGDSHAAMWQPALEQIATARHWRLETMGKVLCPLLDLPTFSPYLGRDYNECTQWRGQILARLRAERPAVVVLDMARRYTPDYGFTVYGRPWLESLARTVATLRSTGARVLVLGPIPDPHAVVPTCLSEHLGSAVDCAPARTAAVDDAGIAAEARATEAAGGRYAPLTDLFCTATRCPDIVGNQLVYRDDNHLTIPYARWLAPVLGAELDRLLATT